MYLFNTALEKRLGINRFEMNINIVLQLELEGILGFCIEAGVVYIHLLTQPINSHSFTFCLQIGVRDGKNRKIESEL